MLSGASEGSLGPPWAQYHDIAFFAGSVEYFVGGSVVLSGASGVSLGPLWAHYHDIAFLAGSVW